ncbi:hypothetical protein CKM354_001010200 [Cercospora kikuchii]|uniref:Uncharacterized protein n=1 Tax=Cercospora kikuchii TaxID=84275 RepID=A0A9P3CUP2_9PEZI|nr:uncharacterized protein CKM354_001010200 [Cercospora kikuchii]GIZ47000.1 hypothetical protein CKM354_001010200 [Cercospora kikuchii]
MPSTPEQYASERNVPTAAYTPTAQRLPTPLAPTKSKQKRKMDGNGYSESPTKLAKRWNGSPKNPTARHSGQHQPPPRFSLQQNSCMEQPVASQASTPTFRGSIHTTHTPVASISQEHTFPQRSAVSPWLDQLPDYYETPQAVFPADQTSQRFEIHIHHHHYYEAQPASRIGG